MNLREINDYDVVVIGGGPGGIGAAVAAGRSGAKTLLLGREGCLGGGMTTMMVCPFMPHETNGGGESRRVMGDYVLSYEDFKTRAKFEDAIACCAYCIDIHGDKQNETRAEHCGPGEFYQIPTAA